MNLKLPRVNKIVATKTVCMMPVTVIILFAYRSDCSVEVWNLDHTPHIERTIPGRVNSSVEALTWCGERLFSSGLQGTVTEYNLQSLLVKVMLLFIICGFSESSV